MLWAFRLSVVKDPARDVLRLVGADSDDCLVGIFGGKSMVRSDCADFSDSDIVRLWAGFDSKYPGSLYLEDCDRGAELRDTVLFVLWLLADLRDGALDGLAEERRSGTTTTGIPPSFSTCRRDFPLEEVVLVVVLEAKLRCLFSGICGIFRASVRWGSLDTTELGLEGADD